MAEALLHAGTLTEEILPPDSHLVMAGLVKDGVLGKIHEDMERRFPKVAVRLPIEHIGDQGAVAYAYLQCAMKFREAFDRLEEPLIISIQAGIGESRLFWGP